MHVHTRVHAAVRHYHTYTHACGFNIPLTTGCYIQRYYNQIICLLGGVCSNMSLQSHKAINLFCRRYQESPFSLRLIYFSCNLTLLSMPTNPLLCLQTVRAHAVTESEVEYQRKKQLFACLRLILRMVAPYKLTCAHVHIRCIIAGYYPSVGGKKGLQRCHSKIAENRLQLADARSF